MSDKNYIVVGAEVDQARYFLHDDGSIDAEARTDGQPLNVEFIGRMMVDLSRRGADAVPPEELDRCKSLLRHAMVVQDFSVQNGAAVLTDQERSAILDGTTVRIDFETRDRAEDGADRNTRILVVPSDRTLEIADDLLRARGEMRGFRPPLSYELDKALMMASLKGDLIEIIREYAEKAGPDWTQEDQDALEAHVTDAIDERSRFHDVAGDAADDVKNRILTSPLRAFHRSVGIYATNMCR